LYEKENAAAVNSSNRRIKSRCEKIKGTNALTLLEARF
jgi:hypothetical protein